MTLLPDHLPLSDTVAASLVFDPTLTARDRALMLAISWWAGRNPPDENGDVLVPDLPLRRDLGDMRRPDAIWEAARYARLEHAKLRGDETVPDLYEGVLVPTVPASVRRRTLSGNRAWMVEPEIVRTFAPYAGDVMVPVPLVVLARARSRYTLQLVLRLLAWGSGNHPKSWLRRRNDGHRILRVPIADLQREIGIVGKRSPADLIRDDLMPAVDEIRQLTDLAVDIEPWHAPSIRKPRGRVMGFDILIGDVATTVVPEPERKPAEIVPFENYSAAPTPGSDKDDIDIAF